MPSSSAIVAAAACAALLLAARTRLDGSERGPPGPPRRPLRELSACRGSSRPSGGCLSRRCRSSSEPQLTPDPMPSFFFQGLTPNMSQLVDCVQLFARSEPLHARRALTLLRLRAARGAVARRRGPRLAARLRRARCLPELRGEAAETAAALERPSSGGRRRPPRRCAPGGAAAWSSTAAMRRAVAASASAAAAGSPRGVGKVSSLLRRAVVSYAVARSTRPWWRPWTASCAPWWRSATCRRARPPSMLTWFADSAAPLHLHLLKTTVNAAAVSALTAAGLAAPGRCPWAPGGGAPGGGDGAGGRAQQLRGRAGHAARVVHRAPATQPSGGAALAARRAGGQGAAGARRPLRGRAGPPPVPGRAQRRGGRGRPRPGAARAAELPADFPDGLPGGRAAPRRPSGAPAAPSPRPRAAPSAPASTPRGGGGRTPPLTVVGAMACLDAPQAFTPQELARGRRPRWGAASGGSPSTRTPPG